MVWATQGLDAQGKAILVQEKVHVPAGYWIGSDYLINQMVIKGIVP